MKRFRLVLILIIFFNTLTSIFAQFTEAPHLNECIEQVSEYIASDNFGQLKSELKITEVIDTLFLYTKELCNNDISETLLVLTFASLPYHSIPMNEPFTGTIIRLPLPSVSIDLFRKKLNNLPSNIFFNSSNIASDKDKLAHFFGNSFLAYNFSLFNLSKFMSIFVELFENSFKVEGAVDFRDLQVNMLGENFGLLLRENDDILPSQLFASYYLFYTTF